MALDAAEHQWLFVPLDNDGFTLIRGWIHNLAKTPELDRTLTDQCAELLERAFVHNGLVLHENFISTSNGLMSALRLSLTPEGIFVPTLFFASVPETIQPVDRVPYYG